MTKKDVLRVLIKLMGLSMLLTPLPMIIGQLAFLSKTSSWEFPLSVVLIIIALLALVLWLIFFPDSVIKLFRLDKGFEDNQVNVSQLQSTKLINFAVLIIGGLFILHSIAPFLVDIIQRIYTAFENRTSFFPAFESKDNTQLYTNIVELILGFLLITNYSKTTRFILKKDKDNAAS